MNTQCVGVTQEKQITLIRSEALVVLTKFGCSGIKNSLEDMTWQMTCFSYCLTWFGDIHIGKDFDMKQVQE